MKYRLLSLILVATLLPAAPAFAKLYKWVDAEGKIHYSDKVPPEAAARGREEKGDNGMTVNRVEAAKSAQQLEAERRAKAERDAIEDAAAKSRQRRAEQDRILLLTFSSAKEIERARDDRLAAVDGRIRLTEERIETLRSQLERAQTQAAEAERAGRPTTSDHYARIDGLSGQVAEHEAFIAERQRERAAIVEKFDADLVRYVELKADQAPR